MRRNLALTIEYDGTDFRGWQIQPGQRTVQEEIQKALQAVTRQPVKLFAASRTDAGVHARGQVASFHTDCDLPLPRIRGSLAQILPEDIAILDIQEKPDTFHARFDAKGKWYRYSVFHRSVPPVLERAYLLWVREKLRFPPMEEAAKLLTGTHDFSSFGVNSGTQPEDPVKTIYRIQISRQEQKIFIDIVGDSFLYRMVRSIVGTILEIGRGKRSPESITQILEKKDRCAAGVTVDPKGLCLLQVFYEDPVQILPFVK